MHTNNRKHRAPVDTKQRLSKDVQAILSTCLHLFEEDTTFGEGQLDVDSVVAGREQVRVISERRHSPPQTRRSMAFTPLTATPRGSFIPHHELSRI